jgi:hypothetical protein
MPALQRSLFERVFNMWNSKSEFVKMPQKLGSRKLRGSGIRVGIIIKDLGPMTLGDGILIQCGLLQFTVGYCD